MKNPGGREYHDDEIDLKELCSPLYKRKWLIVGIAIIGLIFTIGWNRLRSTKYTEM